MRPLVPSLNSLMYIMVPAGFSDILIALFVNPETIVLMDEVLAVHLRIVPVTAIYTFPELSTRIFVDDATVTKLVNVFWSILYRIITPPFVLSFR
jgi:hypothetical protein